MLAGGARHERPRHDERLLVRERDGAAGPDRGQRGHEPGSADQRRDDDVGGHLPREGRQALGAAEELRSGRRQHSGQAVHRGPIEQGHGGRAVGSDLLGDEGDVGSPGGETAHAELLGEGADEIEGAPTDRSGRSQHGDGLHEMIAPQCPMDRVAAK